MSSFYVLAGALHFLYPKPYIDIVPPLLPFKPFIVYFSGFIEIVLGIMLLFISIRFFAAWGIIILLISIFPANIYLALTDGAVLSTTSLIAWSRLPFQFLLIAIAYWHSKP